jgi:hypothetical protein
MQHKTLLLQAAGSSSASSAALGAATTAGTGTATAGTLGDNAGTAAAVGGAVGDGGMATLDTTNWAAMLGVLAAIIACTWALLVIA